MPKHTDAERAKNRREAKRLTDKVITPQDRRDAGFLLPVLERQTEVGIFKQLEDGTIDRRDSKVISSKG